MTYPLPTLAPTLSDSGPSAPAFIDILQSLEASMRGIFGEDVYIDPDSQDGQLLGVFASAVHDANQAALAFFASYRPGQAVAEGLSSIVKINGIGRGVASYSTVDVVLVGQAGTTITNGIATDDLGQRWTLPASVIIPGAGEITVTATAQQIGAVRALPNTINRIFTPQRGWQTVNNPTAATVGAPVETDAALRRRQAQSVSLPARSTLSAMLAGIESVPGVDAVLGLENDTGSTDANGIPAHSFAFVVDGGDAAAIAEQIAIRKGGAGTHGVTSVAWSDQYGIPATIRFSRPTLLRILVEVNITALAGYVDSQGEDAIAAIAAHINALGINGDVLRTRLFGPANSGGGNYVVDNISIAKYGHTLAELNIAVAYDEWARCAEADITWIVA